MRTLCFCFISSPEGSGALIGSLLTLEACSPALSRKMWNEWNKLQLLGVIHVLDRARPTLHVSSRNK